MRLMQRGQRDEPLQPGDDAVVDQHRPVIVRTAMNDAMTDGHRADAKFIPQPSACDTHRGRNVRNRFDRIGAVGQRFAVLAARPQARTTADAIHLALDQAPQLPSPSTEKTWNLTLDEPALTTRIVSMAITRQRWSMLAPRMRIERRHRAGSHPRARRVRTRRQNDGHPGAEHDAGTICLGEVGEILSPACCRLRGRERAGSAPGRQPRI
jgi:hypothetical protein